MTAYRDLAGNPAKPSRDGFLRVREALHNPGVLLRPTPEFVDAERNRAEREALMGVHYRLNRRENRNAF